ncbi:hypothetical protein ACGF12_13830 [Kitasatospora sp. NPDC048296]|uniref:hypothetical protein n=1 Tax=Kitasatospora sp. NPDC048296 TaxID=3364048 RepID=UPI003717193F
MQITPVTLEGFTGLDLDGQEAAHFHRVLYRFIDEHPDRSPGEEESRLINLTDTLRAYNTLRPRLLEEWIAREERDRALHLVDVRWEALSTAPHWLAAHHSYIVAIDDARIAIDMWENRAVDAAKVRLNRDHPYRQSAYEQILAAGHPPVEPLDIDPSAVAEQHRANLEQAAEYRQGLADKTLILASGAEAR